MRPPVSRPSHPYRLLTRLPASSPQHRRQRLRPGVRLHPRPVRLAQPEPRQVDLRPLHVRDRHRADQVCAVGHQRHHYPGQPARLRPALRKAPGPRFASARPFAGHSRTIASGHPRHPSHFLPHPPFRMPHQVSPASSDSPHDAAIDVPTVPITRPTHSPRPTPALHSSHARSTPTHPTSPASSNPRSLGPDPFRLFFPTLFPHPLFPSSARDASRAPPAPSLRGRPALPLLALARSPCTQRPPLCALMMTSFFLACCWRRATSVRVACRVVDRAHAGGPAACQRGRRCRAGQRLLVPAKRPSTRPFLLFHRPPSPTNHPKQTFAPGRPDRPAPSSPTMSLSRTGSVSCVP